MSPLFFHTKARFQQCKNSIITQFEEIFYENEGIKQSCSLHQKESKKKIHKLEKDFVTKTQPSSHNNTGVLKSKHRKLKLAHIICDQNKEFFINIVIFF